MKRTHTFAAFMLASVTFVGNARAADPMKKGWTVISMKSDWKQIFAVERKP